MKDKGIKSDIVYSAKTADFILKDLIDAHCPDFNTDQAGIDVVVGSISPTISAQKYLIDAVVEDIALLGDSSINHYWIRLGKDRQPFYTKSDLAVVHFEAYLADIESRSIRQGV